MKCNNCHKIEAEKNRGQCSACRKRAQRSKIVPSVPKIDQNDDMGTKTDSPKALGATKEQLDDPKYHATLEEIAQFSQEDDEAYYTKERFPSLSYGSSGSPNPPQMRSRGNA